MADHLSREGRSRVMAAIRSVNTKPELTLRMALRARGALGYRIHLRQLPGKPDIAYTRWRLAVFVDGVFWHGHPDHFNPETASQYWREKIAGNRERDERANQALAGLGWTVLRFWDADIKKDLDARTDEVVEALARLGWVTPSSNTRHPDAVHNRALGVGEDRVEQRRIPVGPIAD